MRVSTHFLAVAAALASTVLGVGSAGRFVMDATTPPIVESDWQEVRGDVRPGATVIMEWHITKRTDCPGYAGRIWFGENDFYLSEPVRATNLPRGVGNYQVETVIPLLAPPGPLRLLVKGHFDCAYGHRFFELGPVDMEVKE